MRRWAMFNAVGVVGAALQLLLAGLLSQIGVHYLLATLLAIEAAIFHNFVWHERWTWRDRVHRGGGATRLAAFHGANGIVSLAGAALLMPLLVGGWNVHVLLANLISIVVCSLVNFLLADRVIYHQKRLAAIGWRPAA